MYGRNLCDFLEERMFLTEGTTEKKSVKMVRRTWRSTKIRVRSKGSS